jgi:hypothetical protein
VVIYNNTNNATAYAVGTLERVAIDRAYRETMRILLVIAICHICVAMPLLPLSLVMRNYRLDAMGQGVKGRVMGRRIEGGREVSVVRAEDGRRRDWGGVCSGL